MYLGALFTFCLLLYNCERIVIFGDFAPVGIFIPAETSVKNKKDSTSHFSSWPPSLISGNDKTLNPKPKMEYNKPALRQRWKHPVRAMPTRKGEVKKQIRAAFQPTPSFNNTGCQTGWKNPRHLQGTTRFSACKQKCVFIQAKGAERKVWEYCPTLTTSVLLINHNPPWFNCEPFQVTVIKQQHIQAFCIKIILNPRKWERGGGLDGN